MGLGIHSNVAALRVQRNLALVTERLQGNFARLSSGLRIATAADDAAGLGISERMRAQIRSLTVAERNAQDGISLAQTAEGALQEVSTNLARMRELAVQAANGTLSATDRATLNTEFQALISEIDRVAAQTTYNGVTLLNGTTTTLNIQVGINASQTVAVSLPTTTASALSIGSLSITTTTLANAAITALDTAIDSVTTSLGASQNRLTSAAASITSERENLAAAESRIRDVDFALETADLMRNTIIQKAAIAVLVQANLQPGLVLPLLQQSS